MKYIYEKDIPPRRTKSYWERRGNRFKLWNTVNEHRFKPNGITDNRKKWERKNALRKVKNFVDYHKQKAGKVS